MSGQYSPIRPAHSGWYPLRDESSITSLASLQFFINLSLSCKPFTFFMASTNFDIDSDESYHSGSQFYYPDEMENYNDKENIGSQHEENQQNVQFTMVSVQKYILSQRLENTVKKTEYDLHVWKRFVLEVGEARKIEDIPADELNISICRFMMEIKKKDGGAYEPATLQSFQRSLQ